MILILAAIFLGLVLIISGDRGAKSLITLAVNAGALSILILLINKGTHPVLAFLIACIIIVAVTLFYQNGINLKTVAAGIAILGVMYCCRFFIGCRWVLSSKGYLILRTKLRMQTDI